jgi:hypothetical protein
MVEAGDDGDFEIYFEEFFEMMIGPPRPKKGDKPEFKGGLFFRMNYGELEEATPIQEKVKDDKGKQDKTNKSVNNQTNKSAVNKSTVSKH